MDTVPSNPVAATVVCPDCGHIAANITPTPPNGALNCACTPCGNSWTIVASTGA